GANLGPDLTESVKKYQGEKLLRQVIEPSSEINEKFRTHQFLMSDGRAISGVIVKEEPDEIHVVTNLLAPQLVTKVARRDVDEAIPSKISPMPEGLANVLTKDEIAQLLAFLESGGFKLPEHLEHHQHGQK
ncbi:MAG: hypothetical protein KDA41_07190, partial [Planctomycetales bacterium]|nr:hypothetical protein [Planctomycetales bacterium]